MHNLILLRHGQSVWNLENRFTGWIDVPLSANGVNEARYAGKILRDSAYVFDHAFTSYLGRAQQTLEIVLQEMNHRSIPKTLDWRLNERHYGALQGLDKEETASEHGMEQVLKWRRSFSTRPPELSDDDPTHPANDAAYANLIKVPNGESLADTLVRVKECWEEYLVPAINNNRRLLVVAHGNSLRALMKLLENLSEDEILNRDIPTAMPLRYKLNNDLSVLKTSFLVETEELEAAMKRARG